jgi:hypothetical protein
VQLKLGAAASSPHACSRVCHNILNCLAEFEAVVVARQSRCEATILIERDNAGPAHGPEIKVLGGAFPLNHSANSYFFERK